MSDNEYKSKSVSSALALLRGSSGRHYMFEDRFIIGRTPRADVCLVDPNISRNHCLIKRQIGNRFTIVDVSATGTFLNERKLIQDVHVELKHRDWIKIAGMNKYNYQFLINLRDYSRNPCKTKPFLSPLSVKMNDLNESQNMEKESMDTKLELVEAEICRLKEELQQKLKDREDELEKEHVKASKESVYNKEQADKVELKMKEMLEEKAKTLEKHERKITEVTKKLEELQKNKNEMEDRHQIERQQLENRCKVEVEELKKKLESSETKNQQYEELLDRLEETKSVLLESELEQQRLFDAKVEVETKLESKIVDLTNERENKEEQVKELKKKLEEKEELEKRVKRDIQGLEDDMMCSICAEIFIEPTALSCGHLFCKMCIKEWNKKKKICPMCRAKITTTIRIFNMDSVIERNINWMPKEARIHREAVIAERMKGKTPQKPRTAKKRRHESQPQAPTREEAVRRVTAHEPTVLLQPALQPRHQSQQGRSGRSEIELNIDLNHLMGLEGDDDPFRMGWVNNRNHRPVRVNSPVPVAAVDLTNLSAVDYEPRRSRARTHTVTSADANSTIDLTRL